MVFMSYIHNIVAGKVEGVIVHAVLGITCSTVLLQNFGRVDIRVLLYCCYLAPPVLWWVERTAFRFSSRITVEVVGALHRCGQSITVMRGKSDHNT